MTQPEAKPTFASMLEETKTVHLKSHLHNLTHDYVRLDEHIRECQDVLKEIEAMGTAAEAGTRIEGDLQKLHLKAVKLYSR